MKILVAGSTGRVGRYLVEQLAQAGHHVRALTRNAAKAQFSGNVEVVEGDLKRPETLESALEGVTGLHLINFGGDDYAPLETGPEIVAMAEKAGVKRVTVLRGGEKGSIENAVEASSLAWTMLQPVEFMTGALDYAPSIRTEGVVRQPFANRKTAIVHEADIAAVGAVALTQDGHGGKAYNITGPEVLTPRDLVRMIGEAAGREIRFIELTPEEAKTQWQAEGTPAEFIDYMLYIYGSTPPAGYTLTQTVEEVTGRTACSFAQWARENAHQFC
jgi:uncharacterized protein YbjT (DUF2867 family)